MIQMKIRMALQNKFRKKEKKYLNKRDLKKDKS